MLLKSISKTTKQYFVIKVVSDGLCKYTNFIYTKYTQICKQMRFVYATKICGSNGLCIIVPNSQISFV